ncbi:MAG: hypothetical protein ACXVCV_08805, partial [Polyangia bacterium]
MAQAHLDALEMLAAQRTHTGKLVEGDGLLRFVEDCARVLGDVHRRIDPASEQSVGALVSVPTAPVGAEHDPHRRDIEDDAKPAQRLFARSLGKLAIGEVADDDDDRRLLVEPDLDR